MAGHSKWAQIKRAKAVTDQARSKTFGRLARVITLESKKAAGNLSSPSLQSAIQRAKEANMPKDNIERAIAKGTSKEASDLETVTYECYGPGGSALIATAVTDNRNRTTQEIKHLLSKNGYELAAPGSAMWAFTKSPDGSFSPNEPLVDLTSEDEQKLFELLDLFDEHDDVQDTYTNVRGYEDSRD
ncbi:MAG TPA: YebC/PmpR family DNA-binding transcriptional regulator [Candidatus Paceibacterota bacterium]|nr:YebC/PmpR family DNA-binding transcriptional regulator [Candidatus Paceibacterota bacterium]